MLRMVYIVITISIIGFILFDPFQINSGSKPLFDWMLEHRLQAPLADENIVIIEITEESIYRLQAILGRFPWSRQPWSEVLEKITAQSPKAIILDVLFEDLDHKHYEEDKMLEKIIVNYDAIFSPFIRLNSSSDATAPYQVKLIPGVKTTPTAQEEAHIALTLPYYFWNFLEKPRLGYTNQIPDEDLVFRHYSLYQEEYGYQVPSIIALVANYLEIPITENKILLNWSMNSYRHYDFADIYMNNVLEENLFKDNIVILQTATVGRGSQYQATPIKSINDRGTILATTIDNVIQQNYFKTIKPSYYTLSAIFFILILFGLVLAQKDNTACFDVIFLILEVILLLATFLLLSYTTLYIDTSGIFLWGLVYFTMIHIAQCFLLNSCRKSN